MLKEKLRNSIYNPLDTITFEYAGKSAGVDTLVTNYKRTYTVWFGDFYEDLDDIDIVMNKKFFDGKSLNDLCEDESIVFDGTY
ncbi:hypothetical protein M0R79_01475 [Ignavigranum ruoffiae]|uniref:hypothetical protein n=1 Tax=Ignavigranum ruoffiae TaxID=89093 RepID=UPI00206A45F0|nr:hypothetical protein [Ignavigranum ruoffiae]UPQ86073.1 hypothetical protein M0R79_01475 [Ignavigranum ruoffiae]